jgi:hypothetical protein
MGILNCAANGLAEMEFGRESKRGKCMEQTAKYWYLDIEDLAKQHYEWQESNMSVRSWTTELKDKLYNIRLAFVWRKQQECDLREIT